MIAGGPSKLELFDYKPKLQERNGKPIPQSFVEGKRFAFMQGVPSKVQAISAKCQSSYP